MAWDTQYRPAGYEAVVGQESHAAILREIVSAGAGFEQSYVFSGPFGSGKTTMGRILARALLCDDPQRGNPCDACLSCRNILRSGSSESFVEVDAATNSGKEDIRGIVESLQYATFSGTRRIYLFDEAHQLSKGALDALLKVMEDCIPGTEDKWLICIFCTTAPESMSATIFDRCAPSFTIKKCTPEQVADRLAYICDEESVVYDRATLELIAAVKKCHFRGAIKAMETVAKFGSVDRTNTARVLNLGAFDAYLAILEQIGQDEAACQVAVDGLLRSTSPASVYHALTDLFMVAYRAVLGAGSIPLYLDKTRVKSAGKLHGSFLVAFATHMSSRLARPSEATLRCDLSLLHQIRVGTPVRTPAAAVVVPQPAVKSQPEKAEAPSGDDPGKVSLQVRNIGGVHVDERAVNRETRKRLEDQPTPMGLRGMLSPEQFRVELGTLLDRLSHDDRRPA